MTTSSTQIKAMTKGGKLLGQIKRELAAFATVGTSLSAIEALAQKMIKASGGKPSFAMVPGYSFATCINLNQGLVHGVPDDKVIGDGDIVSIDVGLYLDGYHTDTSTSFIAGTPTKTKQAFLAAGQKALDLAISEALVGHHVGHISRAIQTTVEGAGYSVARNLTGHGIGHNLHQLPSVPCFVDDPIDQTPLLTKDITLAIEAIYMAGSPHTVTDPVDLWTINTKDGKIAAVFEETITISSDGPIILTI